MKKTWSITESVYVYYSYNGNDIFIANPELKKYFGSVKKISETNKEPELLKNENLTIQIKPGGKYVIDINGKEYNIKNLHIDSILPQLSEISITNGKLEDIVFGFNPELPDKTSPLIKGSQMYNDGEKEFIRKMNLQIYSKTTKYKVGHKYESEEGTFLYLGLVSSHFIVGRNSSDYNYDGDAKKIHAWTNDFDGQSKIEDIFRDYRVLELRTFPDIDLEKTIFIIDKNKSLIDLGEYLKEPAQGWDIKDTWEDKVRKYMEENKTPLTFGSSKYMYDRLSGLISSFSITSTDSLPLVTSATSDMMKEILVTNMNAILLGGYDNSVYGGGMNIYGGDSINDQVNGLLSNLEKSHMKLGENYYCFEFCLKMFGNVFGISLKSLAEDVLTEYIKNKPNPDKFKFEDLIENFEYYRRRYSDVFMKNINFTLSKEKKFSAFFSDGAYLDTIKEIYTKAMESGGENLKEFYVENLGTPNKMLLEYEMVITLEDILNHFGVKSLNDLPEDFKNDFTEYKHYTLTITTRDNIQING